MTKIDTKEMRKSASDAINLKSTVVPYIFIVRLSQDIFNLCDAYDEAQREIFEIKKLASSFQKKLDDFGRESIERISTLEGLLRETNEKLEHGSRNYNPDVCMDCGIVSYIIDVEFVTNHKPDCLFTRIQKELGEG